MGVLEGANFFPVQRIDLHLEPVVILAVDLGCEEAAVALRLQEVEGDAGIQVEKPLLENVLVAIAVAVGGSAAVAAADPLGQGAEPLACIVGEAEDGAVEAIFEDLLAGQFFDVVALNRVRRLQADVPIAEKDGSRDAPGDGFEQVELTLFEGELEAVDG